MRRKEIDCGRSTKRNPAGFDVQCGGLAQVNQAVCSTTRQLQSGLSRTWGKKKGVGGANVSLDGQLCRG